MHDYSLFGLRVRSEIPLPELHSGGAEGEPDVVVRVGAVNGRTLGAGLHIADGAMIYVAPDAARYRISDGSEIVVEPNLAVPERNVRLYLLGSAFGALLHQRGLLPLHANAIEIDGAAVAFMGPSGSGKSTLAAWLNDRGFRLISDDVCVVEVKDGEAFAMPGLPRLRLWEDALEDSGRKPAGFHRSYIGDDRWNKFDVRAEHVVGQDSATPLALLCELKHGEKLKVDRLGSLRATEAIFANTYRGNFIAASGTQSAHWQAALDLVRTVPVHSVERKWNRQDFDVECETLLDLVRTRLADRR